MKFQMRKRQHPTLSRRTATLAAVGAIVLWCWSALCYAFGTRLMGPMTYLALMSATGSVTAAVIQIRGGKKLVELVRLPLRVFMVGFIGVSLYTIILGLAFGIAADRDIGQVALLNYLWPIWIVLLSALLLDEKPLLGPTVAGAFLGLAGVVMARGVDTLVCSPASMLPHLLALVAGLLWALYCVLLRRWRVVAAILAVLLGECRELPRLTAQSVFWVLFAGIGPVGLAYHWWELGMKRGNANLIALLAYFIPVGACVLIAIFRRETMNAGLLPGAAMIAAGAWIASRAGRGSTGCGEPALQ